MKYLFIGAHTDEELCFAGIMIKLLEQGHDVESVFFSYCTDPILKKESLSSGEIIGVMPMLTNTTTREFIDSRQQISDWLYNHFRHYDFVFTHSVNDRHPDHRTIAEESLRVFNCNIITYIGPWNGEEQANYFVGLTEEQLEKKIAALACYKSQSHRKYMNPDFIRSWAVYNGIKCGKKFAEGFRIHRLIS